MSSRKLSLGREKPSLLMRTSSWAVMPAGTSALRNESRPLKKHCRKKLFRPRDQGKQNQRDNNGESLILAGLVTQAKQRGERNRDPSIAVDPIRANQYYIRNAALAYKGKRVTEAMQHLETSLTVMKLFRRIQKPTQMQLQSRRVMLPPQSSPRKTLVLDLDQTLVHCVESLQHPHQCQITMVLPQGTKAKAGINVRPGAKEFISRMAQLYEVVVFTASHSCYGKAVVELLDPGKVVRACLFRENCWLAEEGFYVKDLRVVGGRNLEDIVLVDNAAYSYGFQLDNAVPILNYYSGEEDRELASLQAYLRWLSSRDILSSNRAVFKLQQYHHYSTGYQLVCDLYS